MPLFATSVKHNNYSNSGSKTYSKTSYLTVQKLDTIQSVKYNVYYLILLVFLLVKTQQFHALY